MKKRKTPAKAAPLTIAKTALSRDGSSVTISLSDKRRVRVTATIAHAARVRVGARWTAALEARLARLADEQRVYARALDILAKNPRVAKSELARRLGGDALARAALKSLAESGWL